MRKEQEEAKTRIEKEEQAWNTELNLDDVIGCQADNNKEDEDGFQEVKEKPKHRK